jgi:hypothetical protein
MLPGESKNMVTKQLVFLGWIGIVLVLFVASTAMAEGGPRVSMPKTVHDFGEVFEDKELNHTFEIQNTGDAVLEIKKIDSDCTCTTEEADRRIPPGGTGRVKLTIAPFSVLREFTKNTTLFLNDPERPQVVLSLKGVGKPFIEIQPSHIVRLRGKPGEELSGKVRFISNLPGRWEIKEARTDIPDSIDVTVRAEEPGRIYVVEVRNKQKEEGNYAGKIELFTTSEKRPRMIMRVFGEISFPSAGSS